jgi:hypothetical protein
LTNYLFCLFFLFCHYWQNFGDYSAVFYQQIVPNGTRIFIESTNTRLRINGCALSRQRISLRAPLFSYQNSSINKGIRAQQENFTAITATKGATVGTQARVR